LIERYSDRLISDHLLDSLKHGHPHHVVFGDASAKIPKLPKVQPGDGKLNSWRKLKKTTERAVWLKPPDQPGLLK